MRLLCILFFFLTTFTAYSRNEHDIIIAGTVDPALRALYATNELVIRKKETTNRNSLGEIYRIPISATGSFKITIPAKEHLFYISFEFENKQKDNWTGRFYNAGYPRNQDLREVYLLEAGDSLLVDIRKEGRLTFTGKGSEKLNCEWLLYNIEPIQQSFHSRAIKLINEQNLAGMLAVNNTALEYAISMRSAIIDSYRSQLSKEVAALLELDAVASVQHHLFLSMQSSHWLYPSEDAHNLLRQQYGVWAKKARSLLADPALQERSAFYADMLLEMELDALRLFGNSFAVSTAEFNRLYASIRNNYQGKLKDKMLFIFFQNYGNKCSTESRQVIDQALLEIQNNKYRSLLAAWKQDIFSTFPFELPDAAGKIHKLSDYKGKVVVIDFWFTGCGACLELAATMDTIVPMYRNNKDIVFLSVSTDHKEVWAKSVAAGKYTSNGMINLHTGGKGHSHPLIKHYKFKGYPQQLIISKTGELVTSSPPRSDSSEASKQAFIKILNDQLQ